MIGFKKLILTSAILAASSSAMAMQAMDEDSLSSTTGQDGITINVASSNISNLDVTWVDRGGFTGFTDDGALVINNLGVSLSNLNIVVDAGSNTTDNGQLNIDISTANAVTVSLGGGNIEVATGGVGSAVTNNTPIIKFGAASTLSITNGINANLKLGNRAVGENFMTFNTASAFDVVLSGGVTVMDTESTNANALGHDVGIGIGTLTIRNLDLAAAVNVADNGLTIDTTGTTIGEVALETIKLGDQVTAASLGDVYLNGLTANTVLTISGHP